MLSTSEILQLEHIHPLALRKHLVRHFHKHAPTYVHVAQHVHHALSHCGELLIVLLFGISGVMFANFTWNLEWMERTSTTEIATYLAQAIAHPENILKNWNLISIWKMDDSVENTFSKWYCTYGAARISPEFFPFTDELTQQRTRGGNAVDRCANAEATWYKIWNTPVVGSLVVYEAGWRFGQYGHVGKVMYYSKWLKKIIVRDMAWVSRFTMSDRRDDLTTANVECYIYNNRNGTTPKIVVPVVQTWSTVATQTWDTDQHNSPTTPTTTWNTNIQTPVIVTPTIPITPTVPVQPVTPVAPTQPVIVVTPPVVETPVTPTIPKDAILNFDDITDPLALHLIWQREVHSSLTSASPLAIGEEAVFTITIKDKQTQEDINGLLPIGFSFITSNDNISANYNSVKLISDGKIEIHIKAVQAGSSSLIINFWDEKIGRIGFTVE